MEPAEILKKSYARVVVPESDGSYTAEILEFPGCVASAESAAEALSAVEEVALDWLAATIEQGQSIPEPLDHSKYSGKLVVRMPKGLHKRSAMAAQRDGVSLNQFIVTCLAEAVGERSRPLLVYPQVQAFANFSLGLAAAGGTCFVRPISSGTYTPQVATSANHQLLNVAVPRPRDTVHG